MDAISEIVVADDSESDAEASKVEDYFEDEEEEEEQQQKQQLQASAKLNHRLQQLASYQPGTASRKEHKYSSFCQSSKRWTIKLFPPSGSSSTEQLDIVIFMWG